MRNRSPYLLKPHIKSRHLLAPLPSIPGRQNLITPKNRLPNVLDDFGNSSTRVYSSTRILVSDSVSDENGSIVKYNGENDERVPDLIDSQLVSRRVPIVYIHHFKLALRLVPLTL